MLDFLNIKFEIFGLDIADNRIKAAKIEKKGKEAFLTGYGKKEIEREIVNKGRIKNEELLSIEIKRLFEELSPDTRYVSVCLPEEKSFLQIMEMPVMSKKELEKAIRYEAENYVPLPTDDLYLDFKIISENEESENFCVLMVALPKKIVDLYLFCIKKSGLIPAMLEIDSMAIARAIMDEKDNENTLIIDFGKTRTGLVIFSEGVVKFVSSADISSDRLTKRIAEKKGISLSDAEAFKIKNGIETEEALEIMKPLLEETLKVIEKHLDYYNYRGFIPSSKQEKEKLKKVVICGGGANLKGFSQYLSENLNIPVAKGNPFINFSKGNNDISVEEALSYSTAFGLALRNLKKYKE